MTTRKSLKDFLNSKNLNSDQINYVHEENESLKEGVDLGTDPNTNKELIDFENNAGLLGQYLKYLMNDFTPHPSSAKPANTYSPGSGTNKEVSSVKGSPLSNTSGQDASFFTKGRSTLESEMSKYSNSGKFNNLEKIVDKDSSGNGSKKNHTFLSDVEDTGNNTTNDINIKTTGNSEAVNQSLQMLINSNRFAPAGKELDSKSFSGESQSVSEEDLRNLGANSNSFGEYHHRTTLASSDNKELFFKEIKKLGASLLLKASGRDTSDPINATNAEEYEIVANSAQGSFNSANGLKLNVEETNDLSFGSMRPRNADGSPRDTDGKPLRLGRGEFIGNDGNTSRSVISSHVEQFDTNSNLLLARAVKKLIVAKEIIDNALLQFSESLPKSKNDIDDQIFPGPYPKGSGSKKFSFERRIMERHVFTDTFYDYDDCLRQGIRFLLTGPIPTENKMSQQLIISDSPGYWLVMFRRIIDAGDLSKVFRSEKGETKNPALIIKDLSEHKLIRMINVFAKIGDIVLRNSGGGYVRDSESLEKGFSPLDVDNLKETPATRVSKSRTRSGRNKTDLAWRSNSVQSMYLLPGNVIRASVKMGKPATGPNPLKGVTTSDLINETVITPAEGSAARIHRDVVESLENRLDAEYVPFYFHDLRTNEIISFHAFLTTLTDTFSAGYNPVSSYGRMDPVQIYKSTTRSIGLSFIVAATSKEDFNLMWHKINKLVTLLYPQWTKGTKVKDVGSFSQFTQPFSQVLGASPVIRLRVGDVIKSNYSKFALSRVFGIGDGDTNIIDGILGAGLNKVVNAVEAVNLFVFYSLFGSPLANISYLADLAKVPASVRNTKISKIARSLVISLSKNGFGNPVAANVLNNILTDPSLDDLEIASSLSISSSRDKVDDFLSNKAGNFRKGFKKFDVVNIVPNLPDKPYQEKDSSNYIHIPAPYMGIVQEVFTVSSDGFSSSAARIGRNNQIAKTYYAIQIIDSSAPTGSVFLKTLIVPHEMIKPSPEVLFGRYTLPFLSVINTVKEIGNEAINQISQITGIPSDSLTPGFLQSDSEKFMSGFDSIFGKSGNTITKSFEANRGRGLGGVITSMNFNWLEEDVTWDVDWNSRAPKMARISISFSPIHDIPPGLDHSGYNRAPIYNVGDIMHSMAGDPYDDNGVLSKEAFKAAARGLAGTVRKK